MMEHIAQMTPMLVLAGLIPGMLGMFVIGCAGAGLAIVAQRGLWRSARLGT